jgi:transposase
MIAMPSFSGRKIYLACGSTDMRKAINGLSIIVQKRLRIDPFGPSLFVFCNRGRNRLKVLEWDGDGFWLYVKRLEKGRFQWPRESDSPVLSLCEREFAILLGGTKLNRKLSRDEIQACAVG